MAAKIEVSQDISLSQRDSLETDMHELGDSNFVDLSAVSAPSDSTELSQNLEHLEDSLPASVCNRGCTHHHGTTIQDGGERNIAVGNSASSVANAPKTSKDAKVKKREDKGIEHVLKALQSLETPDEKLAALCKKYTELLDENRTLQNTFKQSQRSISVLSREKDQLQSEHSKAVLAKSKLEGLCRELQRHNKLVKEESIARAKEDDEKRKEVTNKFQTTINEIQQQMNDHYQKNSTLREENLELANKLKGLIEQYELREQHIEKVFKHKDLESQLYDAKLAQAMLQITEEKEKGLQEKQLLLQEAMDSQKRVMILEEQEKALKAQVAMYSEKYEEFQSTLSKSNEVFQNFKTEMDKMTKKIKKLEKDTTMYRARWESSNKALLTMAEEKTRSDKDVVTLQNKVVKLESLCRALQEERKKGGGVVGGAKSPELVFPATAAKEDAAEDRSAAKTPPPTQEEGSTSPETAVNTAADAGTPSITAESNGTEPASTDVDASEESPPTDETEPSRTDYEAID